MAGAAALAMIAAPAMADTVYHASATAGVTAGPTISLPGVGGAYLIPNATINETSEPLAAPYLAGLQALNIHTNSNQNVSMILIQGSSAANNGTASDNDGATFTLKGAVSTDCAYYTGNASTTIDFGTIGIYA
ncbi:hypothetical protein, partial [Brevundimonas sp. UBA7838]